jgi:CheY-like chemotaxis protein
VTILVADDDRTLSHLMCTLLRDRGYSVVAVYDSMQTLMVAMRPPQPDLILLDIHMPAGTGEQALKKLKSSAKTSGIPVIVITASIEPDIQQRVEALGATGFLFKPIDPEEFLTMVRRALGEVTEAPRGDLGPSGEGTVESRDEGGETGLPFVHGNHGHRHHPPRGADRQPPG